MPRKIPMTIDYKCKDGNRQCWPIDKIIGSIGFLSIKFYTGHNLFNFSKWDNYDAHVSIKARSISQAIFAQNPVRQFAIENRIKDASDLIFERDF